MKGRAIRYSQLILGVLLSLIVALSSVGLLALAGWLISAAALAGFHPATAPYFNYFMPAAAIRFFALIRILSRYGERIVTHDATFRILSNLRVWFYQKLEPLVPAYLLKYRTGDLMNRCVSDVDTLDQAYLGIVVPFVVAILFSFLMLIFFHYFSQTIAWMVFSILFTVIVVASGLATWVAYRLTQSLKSVQNQYRLAIVDFISGLKTFFMCSAEKKQLGKIKSPQFSLYQLQGRLSHLKGLSAGVMILMTGFTIWLVLYFGFSLFSGPILCLLVFSILAAFEVLMPLPRAFLNVGELAYSGRRMHAISNNTPLINFNQSLELNLDSFEIAINKINFSYIPELPILKEFNLSLAEKEKLIIEGPSGSGKSTLLSLMARIYDPVSGDITIGHKNIKLLSESQVRDTVTLITQQDYFFNETVKENLHLAAPLANDEALWSVLEKVGLDAVVKQRKGALDAQMGEYGGRFSAGQLRRFSIARALLRDTPILLLDEPTEGLDADSSRLIWDLLQNTMKDKTLIVVTHLPPNPPIPTWRRVAFFEQRS